MVDYISPSMQAALHKLRETLTGTESIWLVGGSCGLLLHGLQLDKQPRDLDIYADERASRELSRALQPFAVDQYQYNETEIYSSYLSHYTMEGIAVELVGSFKVRVPGAVYAVEVETLMSMGHIATGGQGIKLMPLAHELVFNVLRNRPDRFNPIAEHMRGNIASHLPILREIIARNRFDRSYTEKFSVLLQCRLSQHS